MKRSWDLALIVLLSLLLAAFIYLVPDSPARIIIGIPFIIFFPGYALIATLFPEKKSLDTIERIALSFGLSIAVVPLIGFGLNYTPFGIRLDPILWSLILFNAVMSVLGIWRRSVSSEPFLPFNPNLMVKGSKEKFRMGAKTDKVLTVVLVLSILSSVVALAYVVAVPRQGEQFTEFYVLGPGGKATDYPHNLTVNQSASVILGMANHEYHTVNYTVEVWLANATFSNNVTTVNHLLYLDGFSVVLDHVPVNIDGNWTPEWQQQYNFSSPVTGSYKIWFVLQVDGEAFQGVKYQDYVNTSTQDRFMSMINSKGYYSLNLNLNISG
jgi:uncharacterized membrane protein